MDLNLLTDPAEKAKLLGSYRVYQQTTAEKKHLAYVIGLIDYFQLYTFGKSAERCIKRFIKCNSKLETSSQPPDKYAERFMNYVKGIITA